MKKFNFRLQRVLDVKNTVEEVRRRNFLAASNEHRKRIQGVEQLYATLMQYQNKLRNLVGEKKSVQILNLYYNYFAFLGKHIEYQKKLVQLARHEMEKKRKELVEAVKGRKILERLREKQLVNFRKDVGKIEQAHLDEISGIKFSRDKDLRQDTNLVEGI
ncbi:flagellar export protein FliJ [candidate division KSB1 bacterium]